MAKAHSFCDFSARTISPTKQDFEFKNLKGQVSLVVNVASRCGYTRNHYTELQELHNKYGSKGLNILAFPCNQFGAQEPGSEGDICTFVKEKYNASFKIFEKIEVNGANEHPLYNFLKQKFPGDITWNFEKFLVNKKGETVNRYPPKVSPQKLVEDIEVLLAETD